jgi:hypothetical protein
MLTVGSIAGYSSVDGNRDAIRTDLEPPCREIARAADAACCSAGRINSSEYANPVLSPLTARTPTPRSTLKVASRTMLSSTVQLSWRLTWK